MKNLKELLFGTGGVPLSAKSLSAVEGLKRLNELGLGCMELEFVYGVYLNEESACAIKKAAEKFKVALTVHAPYYVNLNAREEKKRVKSRQRILDSARIGSLCGAKSVAFHPGFYLSQPAEKVKQTMAEQLLEVQEKLNEEELSINLAPETTGRKTQFGSLEELLALIQKIEGLKLTVDFAHLHARCQGCLKKTEDFEGILEKIESVDKNLLQELHLHCSGINYSGKGEKNHLPLKESDFNFQALMQALKNFRVKGFLICESPNLEEDSLLMKEFFESL